MPTPTGWTTMGEVQVGLPASYYAAMNGFVGVSQDAVTALREALPADAG